MASLMASLTEDPPIDLQARAMMEAYDLAPAEAHAAAAASALAEVWESHARSSPRARARRRVGTFAAALRENARRQVGLPPL